MDFISADRYRSHPHTYGTVSVRYPALRQSWSWVLEPNSCLDSKTRPRRAQIQGFKFTVCVLNRNEPTPTRLILTTSHVDVPMSRHESNR
ncbi:Uncharacterised protein [Mycobacteroides abscessus subsp. abscessus]|nr:Uncharacterised protein [Mycobacteroides abscessus subsp. abscessus]